MTYKQKPHCKGESKQCGLFYSFLKSFLTSQMEIPILYNRIIINKAIYLSSLISIDK